MIFPKELTKKVFYPAFLGNVAEYYDFAVYGLLVHEIGSDFFPSENKTIAIILTFSVYVLGFIARPLGGLFFGRIGDYSGREKALSLSIFLMGFSTLFIALLPNYNKIGILAPILLTVLRFIQGLSVGGELIGSLLYVREQCTDGNRKAYMGSFLISASIIGWLLGALVVYLFSEEMLNIHWRFMFILGSLLSFVTYFIRQKFQQNVSNAYIELKQKRDEQKLLAQKDIMKKIISLALISGFAGAFFYSLFIFPTTYLKDFVLVKSSIIHFYTIFTMILYFLFLPFGGKTADSFGYHKTISLACGLGCILAFPLFYFLTLGDIVSLCITSILSACIMALVMPALSVVIVDTFQKLSRYRGCALSYNLGISLLGGASPMLLSFLIYISNFKLSPFIYISACGFLGLIGNHLNEKCSRENLYEFSGVLNDNFKTKLY